MSEKDNWASDPKWENVVKTFEDYDPKTQQMMREEEDRMMLRRLPRAEQDPLRVRLMGRLRDVLMNAAGYQKRYYFVNKDAYDNMMTEGPSNIREIIQEFKAYPDKPLDQIPENKAGTGMTVYVKYKPYKK